MGSQKAQAELWSIAAQDWADYQETTLLPVFEHLAHDFSQTSAKTLLDVGCGSGLFCQLALQQGLDVSGLDATAEFIAIAQRKAPDGHFTTGDMEELPYSDHSTGSRTGVQIGQGRTPGPPSPIRLKKSVFYPSITPSYWLKSTPCA